MSTHPVWLQEPAGVLLLLQWLDTTEVVSYLNTTDNPQNNDRPELSMFMPLELPQKGNRPTECKDMFEQRRQSATKGLLRVEQTFMRKVPISTIGTIIITVSYLISGH